MIGRGIKCQCTLILYGKVQHKSDIYLYVCVGCVCVCATHVLAKKTVLYGVPNILRYISFSVWIGIKKFANSSYANLLLSWCSKIMLANIVKILHKLLLVLQVVQNVAFCYTAPVSSNADFIEEFTLSTIHLKLTWNLLIKQTEIINICVSQKHPNVSRKLLCTILRVTTPLLYRPNLRKYVGLPSKHWIRLLYLKEPNNITL